MLRPRLIPIVQLSGVSAVKTTCFDDPSYVGDPVNTARVFSERGVDELCILDLEATRLGTGPNFELLSKMARQMFVPISYGGGISEIEDAQKLVGLGFDKVIVNSRFRSEPEFLSELAREIGASSVSASIDVVFDGRNYLEFDYKESRVTGRLLESVLDDLNLIQCGEVLIQSKDRDGLRMGLDHDLVRYVSRNVNLPLIVGGGLLSLDDAKRAWENGASGVAGGAFFVWASGSRSVVLSYPPLTERIL